LSDGGATDQAIDNLENRVRSDLGPPNVFTWNPLFFRPNFGKDIAALINLLEAARTEAYNRAAYHWDRDNPGPNHRPCPVGGEIWPASHAELNRMWDKKFNAYTANLKNWINLAQQSGQVNFVPQAAVNPVVINGIKSLPDGATLTPQQISELGNNVDAILDKSLPVKAANNRIQDVIDLFNNDPRFRFLDQVPGAIDKINKALGQYGRCLK
jgi:hypothetical protein